MSMVIARIVMRYLSGALVAYGILPVDVAEQVAVDPDVVLIVGTALAVITEGAYAAAKRLGWAT